MPKKPQTVRVPAPKSRGPYTGPRTPPKTPEQIGHYLREYRTAPERNWTLEILAEKAEMSLSFISDIERGKQEPSFETLGKLARALGITRGMLLDIDPRQAQPPPGEQPRRAKTKA